MTACASKVLGKDVASALNKISILNDTMTRKQDEVASFVENKTVEIQCKTKFSLYTDESTMKAKLSFLSMSDSGKKCCSLSPPSEKIFLIYL